MSFESLAKQAVEMNTTANDINRNAFDFDSRIDVKNTPQMSGETNDKYDPDKRLDSQDHENTSHEIDDSYDPDNRIEAKKDDNNLNDTIEHKGEQGELQNENLIGSAEIVPEKIKCRNEHLAGKEHPDTGVPFERKVVEVFGKHKEVVVPEFDSLKDVQLPENMYQASDREQFKLCNEKLKEEVTNNKELRAKFDEEQLEQIENGDTPDGYTWHHDAEPGKMQLVDTEIHQKTAHTGGRSIWGGGTENR